MWSNLKYAIAWHGIRMLLFNVIIAGTGILLIAYELLAQIIPRLKSEQLEYIGEFFASFATFIGVFIISCSIYFEPIKQTRPDPGSKWLTAPIVILGCLICIYVLFANGSVPNHIVNGFALLGLAGALFRIQPNPQRSADTF